jgi:hypothetical protein
MPRSCMQVTDNVYEAECFTQYLQSLDAVRADDSPAAAVQLWLCPYCS